MLKKIVSALLVFFVFSFAGNVFAAGGGGAGGLGASVPFMHPMLQVLLVIVIALLYKLKK